VDLAIELPVMILLGPVGQLGVPGKIIAAVGGLVRLLRDHIRYFFEELE
jgi:hypothetical protein